MLKLLVFPMIFILSSCVEKKLVQESVQSGDSCVIASLQLVDIGTDVSTNFSVANVTTELVDYVSTCTFDLQPDQAYDLIERDLDQLTFTVSEGSQTFPLEDNNIPLVGFEAELFEGCVLKFSAQGILRVEEQDLLMDKQFLYVGAACNQPIDDSQKLKLETKFLTQSL